MVIGSPGDEASPLNDEQSRRERKPIDLERIESIVERFKALPLLDERKDDEILGYDEQGLPSSSVKTI